jgi:hypothetical protein
MDDDGILHVQALPGSTQTKADAMETLAANWEISEGRSHPALVDLRGVKSVDREARHYYAQMSTRERVTAVAAIVGSPLSRVIGQFFIGLNRPPVPTRVFTSEKEAIAWLRLFLVCGPALS